MDVSGIGHAKACQIVAGFELARRYVLSDVVFADVIADRAAAAILAHNHPSGELRPSDADLRIHSQLEDAARILGLRILDHVIVGRMGYYSFRESGLFAG